MQSFPRSRRPYPSDVSDSQWRRIEPLLPDQKPRGRNRAIDLREIVNAIHYRWTTGCVWRMLPHDFPAWGTVYSYFRLWQRDGILRRLRDQLLKPRSTGIRNVNRTARRQQCSPAAPAGIGRSTPTWLNKRPHRIGQAKRDSDRAA